MKKRIISALLAATVALSASGCLYGDKSYVKLKKNDNKKISVVCAAFPEYDWVRQLTGSYSYEFDITYLLGSGADIHNFQPSAYDMAAISGCDLFICSGGASEAWVADALRDPVNKDIRVIELMDFLGDSAYTEEETEGMQPDADADGGVYDEHIWLSLKNADLFCAEITDQLCALDEAHAGDYRANYEEYSAKLSELDGKFDELFGSADSAGNKTLIFADRFPFRYFAEDYGLEYYAAFPGCSSETDASFETVAFLASKLDELGNRSVFVIEGSDRKLAEAVIENTSGKDQSIVALNSIQSVTSDAAKSGGATYISYMNSNYNKLKEAMEKEKEAENNE